MSNPDIDVVIITSPNATHYEYTRLAIEAGKHVVVEKPFTVTSAEADQLIDLAKQKGVLLTVYHNRRWDNDFLTVRNLLETGRSASFPFIRRSSAATVRRCNRSGGGNRKSRVRHSVRFRFTFDRSGPVPVRSAGHAVGGFENGAQGSKTHDYFHLVLGYKTFRVILHSGSLVRQAGLKFEYTGIREAS